MRFASSNTSRWAYYSRKKCIHFLSILSQSHQHNQCPQKFALQMGVQVALVCWAGLSPSTLRLELSRACLERVHTNLWNGWVKYKFRVHLIFKINKHMQDLLQISLAWQLQMRGNHQYFTGDINASKLYNTSDDVNQRMVVGCICCIKLPSNINLWAITAQERSRSFGNQLMDSLCQVINNIVNFSLNVLIGARIPCLCSVFKTTTLSFPPRYWPGYPINFP